MVEMFCDGIGIDKKTMLSGLMGKAKQQDRIDSINSHAEPLSNTLDTGMAALMAYTNLKPDLNASNITQEL